jgi:cystathionine beta-lyase/cystathionine gamma-synthase
MENLVIDPKTRLYSRYTNNNNESLKSKIGSLYNNPNVILTNSGLHSNYIATTTIVSKYNDINIIYGNELYHETFELIKHYEDNKNINLYKLNNNILELFTFNLYNQNNILFIESCSNPNGNIFDFSLIQQLRELSLNLYIICDNTWLSSSIFNPFDYDIDIVTISLSKFYSGGTAICGACLFKNNEDYLIVDKFVKITGIHISPLQINIIDQQIDYLEQRIKNSSDLTYQVLDYLLQFPQIVINHPLLKTHNSCNLIKKYFKNNLIPSIFTIGFIITKDNLLEITNKLSILSVETSFGSNLTKIDDYIYEIGEYSFIRLAIGYDDNIEGIKNGLNELIQNIYSVKKIEIYS